MAWIESRKKQNGSGSGGHTILDDSGTALTQRANLQFKGAYSEDNSGDDTTEVNVVRSMTKAQYNLLSADEKVGIINITDEDVTATDLPISGNDPTDTKTYIDSINTTLSGRNNIKYYDMSVTTVNNSYVSPFSAYKSENLPASLQSKTVLSAQVLSHSATNPTSVQFKDYTIYVYSKSAETFDVRVVYID